MATRAIKELSICPVITSESLGCNAYTKFLAANSKALELKAEKDKKTELLNKDKINKLKQSLAEIESKDLAKIQKIDKTAKSIQSIDTLLFYVKQLESDSKAVEKNIAAAEKELDTLVNDKESKTLIESDISKFDIDKINAELKEKEENNKTVRADIQRLQKKIMERNAEMFRYQENLKELANIKKDMKTLIELKNDKEILGKAVELLGKKFIPKFSVKFICKRIQNIMNEILPEINPDFSVDEIDEDFKIKVHMKSLDKVLDVKMLNSGLSQDINFAFAIAVSQVLMGKGNKIPLMVIDDGFSFQGSDEDIKRYFNVIKKVVLENATNTIVLSSRLAEDAIGKNFKAAQYNLIKC